MRFGAALAVALAFGPCHSHRSPVSVPEPLSDPERRAVSAAESFVRANCYTIIPCVSAQQMQPEFLERTYSPELVRSYRQGSLKPRALGIRDGTRDGVQPGWTVYFEHTEAVIRATAALLREPPPANPPLRGLYVSRSFAPLFMEHNDIRPDVPMKRIYFEHTRR
jgi:hypothetical protein